ncbi:Uncharacterised protein family (UPF0236) [Peptostreptococcus anaerobius]|uniref:Uncharacterized protein n=5 Tax=Bacillota TaxID=1239 RepID=A0A379CD75_9FIRM|nr:UPF0236 family protein [Peptostreptococcus anaerobius]SUB60372.1 Uncharacterised protein family (UPF0236) [Peptostreptococcus anaerobius]
METIIQQICINMVEKVLKTLKESKNLSLDIITPEIREESNNACLSIVEEYIKYVNLEMRNQKKDRKSKGLVIKEKDVDRKVITCLGELEYSRDIYFNKVENVYVKPIDSIFGIEPYERICKNVKADLVDKAIDNSYEKSKNLVGVPNISRQSVRNAILKSNLDNDKSMVVAEKKLLKELHIYADEDHVHLQKPNKIKGRACQIVPLVTITEGTENVSKSRRRTINPYHIVDSSFDTSSLWKKVDEYIVGNYEVDEIKKIERLIESNCKDEAIMYMSELCSDIEDERVQNRCCNTCNYIINNWEGIVNRYTLDIPGSCTEGQVSHVLSERFSRNPMGWSKEILGKLSVLRVHKKNGNKIDSSIYSNTGNEQYRDCVNKTNEKLNWSIFDKEKFIFDDSSATRILIKGIGCNRSNILGS